MHPPREWTFMHPSSEEMFMQPELELMEHAAPSGCFSRVALLSLGGGGLAGWSDAGSRKAVREAAEPELIEF